MRVVSILSVLFILFGCASLPSPAASDSKVVAVYFKPGTVSPGFQSASYTLSASGIPSLFPLRPGLNYVTIDSQVDSTYLTLFRGTGTSKGQSYNWFSASISFPVPLPPGSTLALVPLLLTTREERTGTTGRLFGEVVPMPPEQAEAILAGWKKENAAALWTNLFIAGR